MSSNRGFIWIDDPSVSTVTANTQVFNSNSTIMFDTGDTVIANNSITTQSITVNTINNLVEFPDGAEIDPLYYNNAYELTPGHGMIHHNDVQINADLSITGIAYVNSVAPLTGDTLTLSNNIDITGNCRILGSTTFIDSTNTSFADRYLYQNSGYDINAPLASGIITNNYPSATIVSLSGNFTTTTVGTVEASGLDPGDIIQISGSTSNDGIYEVLTHAANVLTIKSTVIEAFSKNVFTAEVAAGTCVQIEIAGLEFDETSGLNYLAGGSAPVERRAIAYDGSAPTFNTLDLTTVALDNTQTKILTVDGTRVKYRTAASIASIFTASTTNFVPELAGCVDAGAGTFLEFRTDPVVQETVHVTIGTFSGTVTTPGPIIEIPVSADYISSSRLHFPIMLYFDGLTEECLLCHDIANLRYAIVRKNGTNFPAGTVSHGIQSFPGFGQNVLCGFTFGKY